MKPRNFLRLRPDNLAGRIALLILAAIVTFQTVVLVTFHVLDVEGRRHIVDQSDFIASIILALDAAPADGREKLVFEFARAVPFADIDVKGFRPAEVELDDKEFAAEIRAVAVDLWDGADVFAASEPDDRMPGALAVALRKGGYAMISIHQHRKPPRSVWRWLWQPEPGTPFLLTPWALSGLLFFLCSAVLVFWTSNAIVAPLIQLARHAEQFPDRVDKASPFEEQGPLEVRELTRSINRMQARIRAMIAARTHVLAAVSHDLKTIITRLSLRAELIKDRHLRERMGRDIALMDAMLRKNLEHLRASHARTDMSVIDLDSVLQTVADQFCDLGHSVTYKGGARHMTIGALSDLLRIFTNLVENAVHYASRVEISLEAVSAKELRVEVTDDGPGIPDAQKAQVFEPFVRGESARTIDSRSGFGLGLSIVRELVKSHGGSVELVDGPRNAGLTARVILPRVQPD